MRKNWEDLFTMKTLMKLIETIQQWHAEGKGAALATLVRSSGSSPLPVGEMMAVSSAFDMLGAVSRGCVESAILEIAQTVMQKDQAMLQHFGVSDQSAWEVGLTCGGEIDVLIEPYCKTQSTDGFLDFALLKCQREEPFFLFQFLEGKFLGKKIAVDAQGFSYNDLSQKITLSFSILHEFTEHPLPRIVEIPLAAGEIIPAFVNSFVPPERLIIVGAGEIAIYLTSMAKMLGFSVVIVDPRSMFATTTRFPQADQILAKWPQDCMDELHLKKQDFLAVLSHDEKIDVPALHAGLQSKVGYIGLLGSLKTRQDRMSTLMEMDWQPADLERIHAPIGIDIASKRAQEIALSVIAEIIKVKNRS